MDRQIALKKLARLLGKKFRYQVDQAAPKADEREAARAEIKIAVALRNEARERMDARYRAILAADPEYQRLKAESRAASEEVDRLSSISHHHKITVGTQSTLFFHVEAQGDTWEEVIEIVNAKRRKATAA